MVFLLFSHCSSLLISLHSLSNCVLEFLGARGFTKGAPFTVILENKDLKSPYRIATELLATPDPSNYLLKDNISRKAFISWARQATWSFQHIQHKEFSFWEVQFCLNTELGKIHAHMQYNRDTITVPKG